MIQLIGWTILHSLWQIALIVSLYLMIKHSWQKTTALKKYYVAVSALVTTFLSTVFTLGYLIQQNKTVTIPVIDNTLIPIPNETAATILPVNTSEIAVDATMTLMDYLALCLPYLVTFWGLGMLYFTLRFFKNLYGVKQLKNAENELISREWLNKINAFKTQLNIQKDVQVFLSKHVKEPITFGHFKPVILLPISLMTGFDTVAIETIILHELAHIKRHDYLVNLGQSIIEIILFYHPFVWWLSKEIRELREHCCDDLVLSLGDNRTTYVETLTALQWRKVGGVTNHLSLSASGGDASFSRRIKRMFGVEEERGSFRQLMGTFLLLLIFAVGGVLLKKEWTPPVKPTSERTFVVHENTTLEDLDELTEEMRDLEIFKSFCWSMDNDKITSVNGAYYDAQKNTQYFDITDIRETPKQFIFEDGSLTEISDFYNHSSIQLNSPIHSILLITDKTTKEELITWTKIAHDRGVQFDFTESLFDEKGKIVEVSGNYNFKDEESDFYAKLPCENVRFELSRGYLPEHILLFPCRDKMNKTKVVVDEDNLIRMEYQMELIRAQNRLVRHF